jgi:hypothetical protein
MWKKRIKNLAWISLIALLVGIQISEEFKKNRPPQPNSTPSSLPAPKAQSSSKPHSPSTTKSPQSPKSKSSTGFESLSGCKLHEDRNNDGDSFKARSSNSDSTLSMPPKNASTNTTANASTTKAATSANSHATKPSP